MTTKPGKAIASQPARRIATMAAIFLLAVAMRAGLVSTFDPKDFGFSDASYLEYARNFHLGRGFFMAGPYGDVGPDKVYAFRPPLFPFVWGLLYGVTGGRYEPMWYGFAVLSSVGCVLAYRVGLRLFRQEGPAAIGGILCAVYPPLVFHGVNLMTEPFFIFFSVLAVLFLFRVWDEGRWTDAAIAGIALGLAALSRSMVIGFAPVGFIWLLFRPHGAARSAARRWALALGFALGLCAALAPWTIRNAIVLRAFVPTTTDGGHGFYVANNPRSHYDARGFYMPQDWRFLLRAGEERISEVEAQRRLTQEALRYLASHPREWEEMVLRRALWFWRPFPHGEFVRRSYVILYAVSFIPLMIFVLVGLVLAHLPARPAGGPARPEGGPARRAGQSSRAPGSLGKLLLIDLLVLYMWAIHALVLAMVRYREPVMPFLILFAALALVRCGVALRRPRPTS